MNMDLYDKINVSNHMASYNANWYISKCRKYLILETDSRNIDKKISLSTGYHGGPFNNFIPICDGKYWIEIGHNTIGDDIFIYYYIKE